MRIAVLLSTYNGAQFLKEQLESIASQTYEHFEVYIRDDGSNDTTINIIKDFIIGDKRFNFIDDQENLGCAGSFLHLLELVDSDIYMFCDQDDIWLDTKIERVYKHFSELTEIDKPYLYHSDLHVVDDKLNLLHDSFLKYQSMSAKNSMNQQHIYIQNYVVGCTTAINSELAQKVLSVPMQRDAIAMHDWWMALVAKNFGIIYFDDVKTINYRQHSNNVLGAKPNTLSRFIKSFLSGEGFDKVKRFRMIVTKQASIFKQAYFNELSDGSKFILDSVVNALGEPPSLYSLYSCYRVGVHMQGIKRNLALIYSIVMDKFFRKGI